MSPNLARGMSTLPAVFDVVHVERSDDSGRIADHDCTGGPHLRGPRSRPIMAFSPIGIPTIVNVAPNLIDDACC